MNDAQNALVTARTLKHLLNHQEILNESLMQGTEVDEDDEVQVKRKAKVDPKEEQRVIAYI